MASTRPNTPVHEISRTQLNICIYSVDNSFGETQYVRSQSSKSLCNRTPYIRASTRPNKPDPLYPSSVVGSGLLGLFEPLIYEEGWSVECTSFLALVENLMYVDLSYVFNNLGSRRTPYLRTDIIIFRGTF